MHGVFKRVENLPDRQNTEFLVLHVINSHLPERIPEERVPCEADESQFVWSADQNEEVGHTELTFTSLGCARG